MSESAVLRAEGFDDRVIVLWRRLKGGVEAGILMVRNPRVCNRLFVRQNICVLKKNIFCVVC